MFEDEKEQQKKLFITISIIILIILTISIINIYQKIKPLPNIKECEEKGFIAGKNINNKIYCFDECNTKILTECKIIKVLI